MRLIPLLCALCVTASAARGQTVEMVNNHPFDIRMPVMLRGVKHTGEPQPFAQAAGDDLVVWADVPALQTVKPSFDGKGPTAQVQYANRVELMPVDGGVGIHIAGRDTGRLAWGVVVGPAPTKLNEGEQAPSTKQDFAASFKPLPLKFQPGAEGQLFSTWTANAAGSGLKLDVELRAFRPGVLDLKTTVTNESAPTKNVYAAVVCRWEQPKAAGRTACYDNRRQALGDGAYSPFRAGKERYLYILRGIDWVNTQFDGGMNALWLNDFTASFTYHREQSGKKVVLPPRWVGANTAQLGQEAQVKDGALYSITEIARPNIKSYESRLQENILPPPGQDPLTITSRVAFDTAAVSDDEADQRFVAYVGYNPQQVTTVGGKITFGVPFTRMGTNYFPFSTLGENFDQLRMEGMSKEGYWPLAPQTVIQWEKFADDIRRDLRILKAMGYELCRLHHLELLWNKNEKTGEYVIDPAKRWEYLDFFFGECDKLQVKVLLDVKLPPGDVAELVKRYRKSCDGVEYDNEILLFQTPVQDIPVWKDVYAAVKRVAPEMPFHLTVHTNTGAFDRIAKEGVKFDRVGAHSYMDSVEAIPTARDNALAVANYAAKTGKEPIITEWNWRFLTRMTFEERAKIYPPIFENVLAARCMPVIYQFQFQDSLAMNPTGLKGIRRYEQLLLSRRAKPEALQMMRLIEKYASPEAGVRRIGVKRKIAELTGDSVEVEFELQNKTDQPMPVVLGVEGPAELKLSLGGKREIQLAPKKKAKVPVTVSLADPAKALPGFYHVFLRVHAADDTLRYGWAELRRPGNVTMDRSESGKVSYGPGALDFDFNRPLTVVYPDTATIPELEATWTVFITLESATGRPVEIFQASDLAKAGGEASRTIVLVTREKDAKPSVRVEDNGRKLVVAGADDAGVMAACMDLAVRDWKNAKDAGARKVGLVAAPKAEAGGKTDLE